MTSGLYRIDTRVFRAADLGRPRSGSMAASRSLLSGHAFGSALVALRMARSSSIVGSWISIVFDFVDITLHLWPRCASQADDHPQAAPIDEADVLKCRRLQPQRYHADYVIREPVVNANQRGIPVQDPRHPQYQATLLSVGCLLRGIESDADQLPWLQ